MTTIIERWTKRRRNGEALNPAPGFPVTTPWGIPGDWQAGHHTGEDHACPTGSILRAVTQGEVVSIGGWGDAYGTHVIIETNLRDGITYRYAYCHMSRVAVRVGQQVEPGTFIGRSGATGRVTGPHLHFEVRTSPFGYANHDVHPLRVQKRPS